MQVNTIFYTGQLVSSLIGTDILTKAITDTSTTVYNLLYGLVDNGDPELERVLEELDVFAQLRCVESVTKHSGNVSITSSRTICLEQLHEIICRIREDLRQINRNLELHKQKYFSSYRKPQNGVEIKNLRKHKRILDQRLEMFMKVVQIESVQMQVPNTRVIHDVHTVKDNSIAIDLDVPHKKRKLKIS